MGVKVEGYVGRYSKSRGKEGPFEYTSLKGDTDAIF